MRVRSQFFDPRQTMHTDKYEVFHYCEPKPNTVEVHHHDFYEIYFLLSGQVDYWVEGRIVHMEPGDLLLISPMELHRPIIGSQNQIYERIVLWIQREYLDQLTTQQSDLNSCFDTKAPNHTHHLRVSTSQRTLITERLADLVREFYSKEFGSQFSADGIFLQFMVQLNRIARGGRVVQEASQELSPLVQKVMRHINENIAEKLTLESLADLFYISKYHLSHAFSREMGVSVYRYIMLRRLSLARQLLSAGESAASVCRNCGFSEYTSFYRAFKSEYGISPREYAANIT